jgi:hypothetical protein
MKWFLLLILLALSGCAHDREQRREIVKTALKEWWNGDGSISDSDTPLLEDQVNYQLAKQGRQAGTLP